MMSPFKATILAAIGFVVGAGAVTLGRSSGTDIPYISNLLAPHNQQLVSACSPEEQHNDMYFVTCGGIY